MLSPRKLCNLDVVVYRTTAGTVVALEDACWHRLVPLSMGKLRGDDVVCGYHGLVYNTQGRCVHMPSQDTINPRPACAAFRWPKNTATYGSGRATRPRPIRA